MDERIADPLVQGLERLVARGKQRTFLVDGQGIPLGVDPVRGVPMGEDPEQQDPGDGEGLPLPHSVVTR